ncbi:MAG: PAC2 family protein [Ilumatobacteraceae bacterium]|nr:PAC2 family protein [Ilumatobacteraceae bacterium]
MAIGSSPPFRVHGQLPDLHEPTLITMLSGWIDASGAAAAAMETLVSELSAEPLITFDADTFIDFRARRPTMELRDGVNTKIIWTTPEIRRGHDSEGHDVLLLTGPEPDSAWNYFATTVSELAVQLGVRRAIGLGAYPFGAPHTRPVGLSCTSPNADLVASLPYAKNSVDVPAGLEAILEHEFYNRGITDVVGLWAQVPHYIAAMAYPAAGATLVEAVAHIAGISVDANPLRREAAIQRERLDQLVLGNPDHADMLRQLEVAYDAARGANSDVVNDNGAQVLFTGELPTMDELAAEVEQFLKEQH